MEKNQKVWKVAKALVRTHGDKAPTVARQRAAQHFQKGDYPTGVIWERIEDAATELVRREAAVEETRPTFRSPTGAVNRD